jgi:hypothetical protein
MSDLPIKGSFEQTQTVPVQGEENSFVFTPPDQIDFLKGSVTVLTVEDRSNPTQIRFSNTYHKIENFFKECLFFKKYVYTGNNNETIEVEYQVIYLTAPLQGYLPAAQTIYTPPKKGYFTMNGPDHVMGTDIWVVGLVVGDSNKYPSFVPRQSPWFSLESTAIYKK